MRGLYLIFIVGSLLSCQSRSGEYHPDTPEEVLKIYQGHFDKNEFELAKALSTQKGKQWIDDISPMILNSPDEATILTTKFHGIDCQIENDTARCECELEDAGERYFADFRLIKVKGNWLVDAPDEDESIEYEDNEEVIKDFFSTEKDHE